MDFPDYMVLNPMHIEFKNIPKIVKVLGGPLILPYDNVAWTPCPKCISFGLEYCKKIGHMPYSFKAVHPKMGVTKLNLK